MNYPQCLAETRKGIITEHQSGHCKLVLGLCESYNDASLLL